MAEAIPALEIRNLHKRYGDLEVLKGISLTARDGDVISILGSSGSGKSTFLRMMNRLLDASSGQIRVDGRDVLALKGAEARAWQSQCAMIELMILAADTSRSVLAATTSSSFSRPGWCSLIGGSSPWRASPSRRGAEPGGHAGQPRRRGR